MVGREIELNGLEGKSILFTWKGKSELFKLIGAKTEKEFAGKMAELDGAGKVDDELFQKMYLIGLNWKKDAPKIKEKEVPEILEDFCQKNGYGSQEVRDTLIDSFVNSGILIKSLVEAGRRARDGIPGDTIEKLVEKTPKRGTDTGEAGQSST